MKLLHMCQWHTSCTKTYNIASIMFRANTVPAASNLVHQEITKKWKKITKCETAVKTDALCYLCERAWQRRNAERWGRREWRADTSASASTTSCMRPHRPMTSWSRWKCRWNAELDEVSSDFTADRQVVSSTLIVTSCLHRGSPSRVFTTDR